MNLCDLNCCDLKYLQTKFDAINKKISNNQKLQDKINTNIFKILKESGIEVEALLKNYYALNEEDYTKTLTSEDDINTLEPGTYKIVKEDMPQNAPTGVASSDYDGTLIQSNSYAILFKNGFDIYYHSKTSDETWTEWEQVAFLSDVPSLTGYATQEWVEQNYLTIQQSNYVRLQKNDDLNNIKTPRVYSGAGQVATRKNRPSSLTYCFIVHVFNLCYNNICYQKYIEQVTGNIWLRYFNGSIWLHWIRIATINDIPSLDGYATQAWVNEQIQDITGGSVTTDWVKSNTWTTMLNNIPYDDLNDLKNSGAYSVPSNVLNIPFTIQGYVYMIQVSSNIYTQVFIGENKTISLRQYNKSTDTFNSWSVLANRSDIPSLDGYATQQWVQSQNYLTEVPDNYATDTEVSQAIAAALVGNATQTWVNQQGFAKETDIPSLSGYATQTWVNQQGFLTEIPEEYITQTELQAQNYATQTWVTARGYQTSAQVESAITEALNGYATQTWVNQQNFAHESDIPSLSGYATQTWVNNQNFATEEWVGQQGYQTVQQVKSLINTATADMVTQTDLDTLNYATENWVMQTALNGYATTDDVTNATSKNNILKYQLDHTYFNLLTENTDLNTLSIGVYSSDSSAISATLLNKPQTLTRGFKLTMSEIVGEGYYSQTIIENITGKIFIRCSENNTWNEK